VLLLASAAFSIHPYIDQPLIVAPIHPFNSL